MESSDSLENRQFEVPVKKPTLLVIGPTYCFSINRRKFRAMADYFDIICATSELSDRSIFGLPMEDFEEVDVEEPFSVRRLTEFPKGKEFTKFLYRGLGKVFREKQFDFILVDSEAWGTVKWQAWLLAKLWQPSALFGEFNWENVKRDGLKGKILSVVYRLSTLADDFAIAGNQAARALLLAHGADPARILVAAQLGVDLELFRPVDEREKRACRKSLGLPTSGFLIGFCGRLVAEKGLVELRDALRRLRAEHADVHLALLGHGPFAQDTGFSREPGIIMLGSRPHFEVPVFMQSLDLFILPSKPIRQPGNVWEEQFGHVLIEAMACGVPAIGSDSGAIPEVVGESMGIFRHGSADSIYDKLIALLQAPEALAAMASRQQERVRQLYSHQAVARIYATFLGSIRKLTQR
jgi:glycosyltransferase involved in cell wall biosynthesis